MFKSMTKAVTYRVLSTSMMLAVTYIAIGKLSAAGAIVGVEAIASTLLYFGHERVWESSWVAKLFGGVS